MPATSAQRRFSLTGPPSTSSPGAMATVGTCRCSAPEIFPLPSASAKQGGTQAMKPVISRIVQALVAVSFVAAMTAVVAPAARADPPPPCYGSGCNGKDPQATGCSGSFAYTVASFTVDYGYIRVMLRSSDWCHPNWPPFPIHPYAPAHAV